MSNLRQAAQDVLELVEWIKDNLDVVRAGGDMGISPLLIDKLRAALAEPEQPVAWMYHGIRHDGTPHDRPSLIWRPEYMDAMSADKGAKATPLYTAPTPRRPLTDEEIDRITDQQWGQDNHKPIYAAHRACARALERAHGITGETNE